MVHLCEDSVLLLFGIKKIVMKDIRKENTTFQLKKEKNLYLKQVQIIFACLFPGITWHFYANQDSFC